MNVGRAIKEFPSGLKVFDNGTAYDSFGQMLGNVHSESDCGGAHCVIHNPSEHHMQDWKLLWRGAGPFDVKPSHFERVCEHDVGHPDPDSLEFFHDLLGEEEAESIGIHGCDGCCLDDGKLKEQALALGQKLRRGAK